jgi:hypothetical protein
MKHGELVSFNGKAWVVVDVEGVFALVDVLIFAVAFAAAKTVFVADFFAALRAEQAGFALVVEQDSSPVFDRLEGETCEFASFEGKRPSGFRLDMQVV